MVSESSWWRWALLAFWIVLAVLLLQAVIEAVPAKWHTVQWLGARIVGCGLLGLALSFSFDQSPSRAEGIERAMAYNRRALVMAAAIFAGMFSP